MSSTDGGTAETLVPANIPGMAVIPQWKAYRCIYCNTVFLSQHGDGRDCPCDITVCPNGNCVVHDEDFENHG